MSRIAPHGTAWRAAGPLVAAALLAACAGTPQPTATGPSTTPDATTADTGAGARTVVQQFEQRQRERAEAAARAGRLAEAAQAWDLLQAVRPEHAEYRERHTETLRQIAAAVAERMPRAQAAQRRGELEAAAQLLLGVLALDPAHEPAAEALRTIERERNRRTYVGKLARNTLMRRPTTDAELRPPATGRAPQAKAAPKANGDRNEVEHAAMLASQGELDDAIALLQAHLAVQRNDAEARRLLTDLLGQKAARPAPQRPAPPPVAAPSPGAVKPARSAAP